MQEEKNIPRRGNPPAETWLLLRPCCKWPDGWASMEQLHAMRLNQKTGVRLTLFSS